MIRLSAWRFPLHRADLAIGSPAQRPFRALSAYPCPRSTHLSCRVIWMLLHQNSSWRQWGQPQSVDRPQDFGEQGTWDSDLRHLERDVAPLRNYLGADLDQVVPQRRQRPASSTFAMGLPSDFVRKGLFLLRSGYVRELAVVARPILEDRRDQERPLHHQASHRHLPLA